jgi:hypothetical protein
VAVSSTVSALTDVDPSGSAVGRGAFTRFSLSRSFPIEEAEESESSIAEPYHKRRQFDA